ncbi:MAG: diguanylate cyclase domain-containing protein [Rhodoblastus sp.]
MKARGLKSWFIWCALAGFGVVLPMMISSNPDNETLVRLLRGLGAAAFIVALVSLMRTSGEVVTAPEAVRAPPAPSTLPGNPLAANAGARPLAKRIDDAIDASTEYDCTVGVLYYRLDSYHEIARTSGMQAAEAASAFIVGMLQMVLRQSDRIEQLDHGRFVVCLVLLKEHQDMLNVAKRIRHAIQSIQIEALNGAKIVYDEGAAIYPAQGADGANLIARAKSDCNENFRRRQQEILRLRHSGDVSNAA